MQDGAVVVTGAGGTGCGRAITAHLAGKIDAEARADGRAIPFSDLLIGTTALHAGYTIVTAHVRHFQMVLGLVVLSA